MMRRWDYTSSVTTQILQICSDLHLHIFLKLTKAHKGPNFGPQFHALQDATPKAKVDELNCKLLIFIDHQDILLETAM